MKLHEQRDTLSMTLTEIRSEIRAMICSVDRKIRDPYGDGSRSNQVNAETDVLPRLYEMCRTIDAAQSAAEETA